jgi:3-deoxy-manno-octulosonate cytidylyltransferase (CMP-KDO synthetase)
LKSAAAIIPARYQSRRFPGKPLAPILGKPMLQHVYARACRSRSLQKVIIATDDDRIRTAAEKFGAPVVMTSSKHKSGTERTAEAADNLTEELIINIQGDEPLLNPAGIDCLVAVLQNDSVLMATLRRPGLNPQEYLDIHCVKLVIDAAENALYFSRSPIPYNSPSSFWVHIGMYGFQKDFLKIVPKLASRRLEKTENLEQLRVLEHGYSIKTAESSDSGLSVNVPQDIIKVEQLMKKRMKKNG